MAYELMIKGVRGFLNNIDASEQTKKSYGAGITKFYRWLEEYGEELNEGAVLRYKQWLKAQGYKPASINSYLMAVKALCNYLERNGAPNYARYIKREKDTHNHKRDSLTVEQVRTILRSIDTSTLEGKRNKALFTLLIATGLRECEVVRAVHSDIRNVGLKTVLYVQGKGRSDKDNFVILEGAVLKALEDYFKAKKDTKPNTPLFLSLSNRNQHEALTTRTVRGIVKGLYKNNGIVSDRLTTHSTRHTAVTLAIANGATVTEVMEMARHSNINTTMIYFHNLNRLTNNAESKLNALLEDGEVITH